MIEEVSNNQINNENQNDQEIEIIAEEGIPNPVDIEIIEDEDMIDPGNPLHH